MPAGLLPAETGSFWLRFLPASPTKNRHRLNFVLIGGQPTVIGHDSSAGPASSKPGLYFGNHGYPRKIFEANWTNGLFLTFSMDKKIVK